MPPNGPELSCGGEQPPQGSSLRGRSSQMLLSPSNIARQIVDGWFRQLERLVRRRYVYVGKNALSYYQLFYIRNNF